MNKTLIAYLSASGVTASVAEELAKTLEADLHEIVPTQRYTDSDLNWMDKKSRSTLEMTDSESRPEIVPGGFDVSGYGCSLCLRGKVFPRYDRASDSGFSLRLFSVPVWYLPVHIRNGKAEKGHGQGAC